MTSTSRVVDRLFIDTADDNYIAARSCFFNMMRVDFRWLGVHALEKYRYDIFGFVQMRHDLFKLDAIVATGNLERTMHGKRGVELRRVLPDLNTRIAPDDFEHGSIQTGMSASNSILGKESSSRCGDRLAANNRRLVSCGSG